MRGRPSGDTQRSYPVLKYPWTLLGNGAESRVKLGHLKATAGL